MAASDVTVAVDIGGEGGMLSDGEGGLIITRGPPAGLAGVISGRLEASIPGLDANADLLLRINNTGDAVDESIEVGGRTIVIRFDTTEGDIFEVSLSNLSLNIADFITVEGDISFSSRTLSDGVTSAQVFAGSGLNIFMGRGPARLENGDINPLASGVLLSDATIGVIDVSGTYAVFAEGTVSVLGVPGVVVTGTAVVRVNTTGLVIDETLTIPGSTGDGIDVRFDTTANVTQFEALDAQISLLGQTISGDFSFSKTDDDNAIRIAALNAGLFLGDDNGTPEVLIDDVGVRLTDGHGALILSDTGLAGELSGTLAAAVPGVSFGGVFTVAINTTPEAVDEIFSVGGTDIPLSLPAGPYVRVSGMGVSLDVLGQTLSGDFVFERVITADLSVVTTLAASNV
ncbi:MAG: hypothetical protein ACYTGQ_20120, partial [Planctomycetota bacterium]